jgi:hypothetical protein
LQIIRKNFETICRELIEGVERFLDSIFKGRHNPRRIIHLLLVEGSSAMAFVPEMMKRWFPKARLCTEVGSEEVIVKGAALVAAKLQLEDQFGQRSLHRSGEVPHDATKLLTMGLLNNIEAFSVPSLPQSGELRTGGPQELPQSGMVTRTPEELQRKSTRRDMEIEALTQENTVLKHEKWALTQETSDSNGMK